VCVCVRERDSVFVRVCLRDRDRECVCVCVCVRENRPVEGNHEVDKLLHISSKFSPFFSCLYHYQSFGLYSPSNKQMFLKGGFATHF